MAQYHPDDTIVAIATPVGEGGLSIIRISGKDSWKVANKVFRSAKQIDIRELKTHTIHYGSIVDENGQVLDRVLISLFKGPHSYTGEDVIEVSSHGGIANSQRILKAILKQGVRLADPGEFTKRAFLNGRIDLTQAEAVIDVIKAKTETSLNLAIKQLAGTLSLKIKRLKDDLMKLYAHLEAYIDFPEEDIEVYSNGQISTRLETLADEMRLLLKSFKRASLIREGVKVVITGRPNVGKSSLFNALLERDRALVSAVPGTTRDHLEEILDLEGVMIKMVDTAGLATEARDPLDQIGMERTKALIEDGQLFIFLVDGSQPLNESDHLIYGMVKDRPILTVVTKTDLTQKMSEEALRILVGSEDDLKISVKNSVGIRDLEKKIIQTIASEQLEVQGEQLTRLRHKEALERSLTALERAQHAFQKKESLEFISFDLKHSIDSLRELIGEIYSEDLLDVIFSEFCIGK